MKAKKLTFKEQYIDKAPKQNYWRGIIALCDGITIFEIQLIINDNQWLLGGKDYFLVQNKFFPQVIFDNKSNLIDFGMMYDKKGDRKLFTDKESVKKFTQELFEEYVKLLIE